MTDFMDPRCVIALFIAWLTLLLILVRKKFALGGAMLIAAVGISVSLGNGFSGVIRDIRATVGDPQTLDLLGVILLIFLLSALLRETRRMEAITVYLKDSLRDPRLVMIAVPSLVGLIPMPGGAMFTASITDEMGDEIHVGPADKVFSNYWFRHCWELAFPLYPGIVLAAGLLHVSPLELTWSLLPLAATAFLGGGILSFARWPSPRRDQRPIPAGAVAMGRPGILVMWPVLAVILTALFRIPLIWGLIGINVALGFAERVTWSSLKKCLRESLNGPIILLVFAVFFFGRTLQTTGFLDVLSAFLLGLGAPLWAISFFLPFCLGALTGVTPGFVGTVFPLLIPLWGDQTLLWGQFAYAGGLAGVFLSPSHLCLSLTQEYFRAGFRPVFRLLLVPVCLVMATAIFQLRTIL